MAEESTTDVHVHETASIEDLTSIIAQLTLDPQKGSSLLNQLQQYSSPELLTQLSNSSIGSIVRAAERFLNDARQIKWVNSEQTPERLLQRFDLQRRWFHGLFIAATVLATVVVALEVTLFIGDLKAKSFTQEIQVMYSHLILMTVAVPVGFPLAVVLFRLLPNTKRWTVSYIHTGVSIGAGALFVVGLLLVVIYHDHFGMGHLSSFHSWMGVLFTVGLFTEMISGMTFFRLDYRKQVVSPGDVRVYVHTIVGECLLATGLATWISGLSHLITASGNFWIWNLLGILTLLLTLTTFVLIFHPGFYRHGRPLLKALFIGSPGSGQSNESSTTLVDKEEVLSGVKDKINEAAAARHK